MDFKKYKVIKPFTIKVDKDHSTYKYDTYTFNVGDVVTIRCNYMVGWTIRILDDRDLFFVGDGENKPMEEILNECVNEITVVNLSDDDLRKILAKKYKCKTDDIMFDIGDENGRTKIRVVIEHEDC